jgi:hypothetical protein
LTPRRISRGVPSASTATCRSRISRVDIWRFGLLSRLCYGFMATYTSSSSILTG